MTRRGILLLAVLVAGFGAVLYRGGIRETEESLFPDPEKLTVFRMSQLSVAIVRYREAEAHPPLTIDSLQAFAPAIRRYRLDGWDHEMEVIGGDSVVLVRSKGSDGEFDTWDDIIQHTTSDSVWYSRGGGL